MSRIRFDGCFSALFDERAPSDSPNLARDEALNQPVGDALGDWRG
jgi:hypothetical protein